MSLVLTFLCATNQVKVLMLDETLDFHKNLTGEKGIASNTLDMAKKSDFIENKLEQDKDQTLVFAIDGDK